MLRQLDEALKDHLVVPRTAHSTREYRLADRCFLQADQKGINEICTPFSALIVNASTTESRLASTAVVVSRFALVESGREPRGAGAFG
jgi:hypothetical protein